MAVLGDLYLGAHGAVVTSVALHALKQTFLFSSQNLYAVALLRSTSVRNSTSEIGIDSADVLDFRSDSADVLAFGSDSADVLAVGSDTSL